MKATLLKIALVLLMITAANNSFAAKLGNQQEYTELPWITNFNKIEVHGNVQLHLLSGEKNRVQMNSTYYNHNALVQVENGVLRITCYRTERLYVWVTVNDLRALSAYDNALVKTQGKLSALALDVQLFNKAKADLDLDCCFTNIRLNDRSLGNVSGTAIESELANNYASTLNSANFTAGDISKRRIDPVWETRIEFVGCVTNDPLTDLSEDNQLTIIATKELRFSSPSTAPIKLDVPAGVESFTMTTTLVN